MKKDKIRFYCHKVLPLVYDNSLSYYELLCKIVDKVNELIENPTDLHIADPVEWDITSQYDQNAIVIDSDGTAYISKQPVPSGILLTNDEYWQVIFNYDDNINKLRDNIAYNNGNSPTALQDIEENALVWYEGELYKTLRNINAGDALIEDSNIEKTTVAEMLKNQYDDVKTLIENEVTDRENSVSAEQQAREAADEAEQQAREATDEEINNRINNILEIINSLNKIYDTVNDLKNGDVNTDEVCMTLGYYSINDNGSAYYKIYDEIPSGYYETLNNGKYAKLIQLQTMCVEQYGAYGDGTHDDTASINNAILYSENVNFNGKTYLINAVPSITMKSNMNVHGNNCILKIIPNNSGNYAGLYFNNVTNINIDNITVEGERSEHTGTTGEWGHGISIMDSSFINMNNVNVNSCWGDGIYIGGLTDSSRNIYINNTTCNNNRRNGISICKAVDVVVENSKFTNTNGTAPEAGIAIEANTSDDVITRIYFNNCFSAYNNGLNCAYATLRTQGDIFFNNCTLVHINQRGLTFSILAAIGLSCNFNVSGCFITAAFPVVCAGINQNSSVTISNTKCYRVNHEPLWIVGDSTYSNACYNIIADMDVISSNVVDGAIVCACPLHNSKIKIKFINCTVTDPRYLGSNNIELNTCEITIENNAPFIIPDANTYFRIGGSNTRIIIPSSTGSTMNKLYFDSPIPIGTKYKIINHSAVAQYMRSRPANSAFIGINAGVELLPANSVLEFERTDANSIVGICYTLP